MPGIGWSVASVSLCMFLCVGSVYVCPNCKRKTAWAINTILVHAYPIAVAWYALTWRSKDQGPMVTKTVAVARLLCPLCYCCRRGTACRMTARVSSCSGMSLAGVEHGSAGSRHYGHHIWGCRRSKRGIDCLSTHFIYWLFTRWPTSWVVHSWVKTPIIVMRKGGVDWLIDWFKVSHPTVHFGDIFPSRCLSCYWWCRTQHNRIEEHRIHKTPRLTENTHKMLHIKRTHKKTVKLHVCL